MANNENTVVGILEDASKAIRNEHKIDSDLKAPNMGGNATKGASVSDTQLTTIASQLASSRGDVPPIPKTGMLFAMLIVIFVAAALFIFTLLFVVDSNLRTQLIIGEGTVFMALIVLATILAKAQSAAVRAYNERAAEWVRADAVFKIVSEMGRGKELTPEIVVALLDSLGTIFPTTGN